MGIDEKAVQKKCIDYLRIRRHPMNYRMTFITPMYRGNCDLQDCWRKRGTSLIMYAEMLENRAPKSSEIEMANNKCDVTSSLRCMHFITYLIPLIA